MICRLVQRLRRRVQLAEATIDKDQAGQRLLFFLQAAIPPHHRFVHARKVVVLAARPASRAGFASNDEFPVVGFFHAAVFPYDHGRDRVRSLNVRNVKALDALGLFRQIQRVLQALRQ